MNKMKNFKRRFSLSVPRTETIEESLAEFTEQFNQLHNRRHHEDLQLDPLGRDPQPESSTFSPTDSGDDPGQPSPGMQFRRQNQRRFSMEVRGSGLYPVDLAGHIHTWAPGRVVALEPDLMGSNPGSATD